jgi:hypothetical protein
LDFYKYAGDMELTIGEFTGNFSVSELFRMDKQNVFPKRSRT